MKINWPPKILAAMLAVVATSVLTFASSHVPVSLAAIAPTSAIA